MQIKRGEVIFRRFSQEGGLQEHRQAFETLEDFFVLIVNAPEDDLADRLSIHGIDDAGQHRIIYLDFQSIRTLRGE